MNENHAPSRRDFLTTSAATAGTLSALSFASAGVHTGSDTLKIGLIGCGGRGTGAAGNALNADPNVRLWAMGDMFADRLDKSLKQLEGDFHSKLAVGTERRFIGFDAYKQVIDSGVDVILLATPPFFRPMHLRCAIEHGKHVFCEKPMAVDGPGVRSILETAALAKQKSVNLMSGFCYRYDIPKRETIKRIHDGAIGDVLAIQSDYLTGSIWHRGRQPSWDEMTYQLRNWYYFTWLSGDFIVEQHVHSLDKARWVLKNETPIAAVSLGGRSQRTQPKFGHIYDHFATVYEFKSGAKVFSYCRQMEHCKNDVSDHVMGTKGASQLMRHEITGATPWRFRRKTDSMYQIEHNELFAAIRAGKLINDGEFMAQSTLMAILGRMAAYTGQRVTWEQALNSKEDLTPPHLAFGPTPIPTVAVPGVTKLT